MKKLLVFIGAMFISTFAIAHTIQWYVGDTVLSTTTCDAGDNITPPTAPAKYGYTFDKWSAYAQLEYIESTGTQYIDTGIKSTSNELQVDFTMQLTDSTRYAAFFGATTEEGVRNGLRMYTVGGNTLYLQAAGHTASANLIRGNITDILNVHIALPNEGTGAAAINGANYTFPNVNTTNNDKNMLIFSSNISDINTPSGTGPFKMWSFQIKKDGTIVFNGIPAKRLSDGTVGVYDTVTGTFLTNQGTGEFIAGPEVGDLL